MKVFLLQMRFILTVISLMAAIMATGCKQKNQTTIQKDGKDLPKIILQTDWYAQAEHGGFYNALYNGFYEKAGLDVEIRQGGPNSVGPEKVATGKAHFAITRSVDIMLFASQGLPLIIVSAYMQRDPQALLLHKSNPVNDWKDLDGKTIMATPGVSWSLYLHKHFDIEFETIALDYGLGRFLTDKDFIQQCFITNEPYYLGEKDIPIKIMLIADSGFSPYRAIYTNRNFAKEHPDIVRAFVAASIDGWRDYIENAPEETNKRISELNPQMKRDFLNFSINAMRANNLVVGNPEKGERLGLITPRRMKKQFDDMIEIGVIDNPIPLSDYMSIDYLPEDLKALALKEQN